VHLESFSPFLELVVTIKTACSLSFPAKITGI
jgi:hypothetical protein